MAVAELSTPSYTKTHLFQLSQLSPLSTHLYFHRRVAFRPLPHTRNARICCSVAPNQVQAPAAPAQTEDPKNKPECFGVFCLTYDLQAEEETKSWKKLINIAVSGAAGMISNHLLFKLASGEVFGPDQPIALKLLGSERSLQALEGVAMELEDSLFPLLREVSIGIDPYEVFQDAEWALLIGAKPRGPGMERAGLLDLNGQIFVEQGKALNAVASRNVKVIVVGNPCNTNALICLKNAPNIPAKNFHALTRLDENRAKCQLALKAGVFYDKVSNMTIWGNHSTTQVPDFLNARINGLPVKEVIKDHKWLEEEFTESIQKRGGVLIKKWGRSSAASTAVSIADAMKSLVTPTPEGDWFSSAVYTNGNPYGIAEDLVFSMPCRSKGDGDYELVKDIQFDDYLRKRITKSEAELLAENKGKSVVVSAAAPSHGKATPWVEKYRPHSLADVAAHRDIVDTIDRLTSENRLPHLLLYGPPGTGKTSTILAVARKLYGAQYHNMILELNASDDRGINVVRQQIQDFASTQSFSFGGDSAKSSVKMVLLDEADAMTKDAQFALRRVIEKYTKNTRFSLICNHVNKIIPALQSRCTRFRFAPLEEFHVSERLKHVIEAEGLDVPASGLAAVVRLSNGDMRKALNILQSTHMASQQITEEAVYLCTGNPLPKDIEQISYWLLNESFAESFKRISDMKARKGLALIDIVREVTMFVFKIMMPADVRVKLINDLADIEYRLTFGCNDKLQLGSLIATFTKARSALAAAAK